jgi:hypothetical protein
VITGLDVTAAEPPGTSVVIHPGMAMDRDGHTIIVNERQHISLQTGTEGIIYLTLEYSEVSDEMLVSPGADEPRPLYLLEAYRLVEHRQPPEEPCTELARIRVSGTGKPIANPRHPRMPQPDEIDLRYRVESGPRPMAEVALGVLSWEHGAGQTTTEGTMGADAMRHLPGIMNLIRVINTTTGYRARFKGAYGLDREIDDCHLLLMSGQEHFTLTEQAEGYLKIFLDQGGVLLGEACGAGTGTVEGAVDFCQSFGDLAQTLGKNLMPVEGEHSLMNSLHVFGGMPEGVAGPGLMVANGGMLYSDGDYGCLWGGGWPDQPAPRETIRSAMELGINLGVFSANTKHLHSLSQDSGQEE